ncbi:hypothetical protein [Pacificibacter marinus]|uniref:hypothetical protein n=1 Tax=Pacificibacter marinus TaxID=658057 RepID=UPI001C073AD9|nr:hypothetical protein [Pacificibacter marinus]MBU2868488.1 hypothetical protein [Pacificibacter marinus]
MGVFARLNMVALAAIVALAACVPSDDTSQTQDYGLAGYNPAAAAQAEQSCLARGGQYAVGGIAGLKVCFERPKDAGKSCSKSTDCDSQCLARSKSCAPVTPLFGCNAILDSSGREVTLCVD